MIDAYDILETINMIKDDHLDIRTVTMGINLLDCASDDITTLCQRIYDKITRRAENLVGICDDIAKEYGIPIINKRISVTPISLVAASCKAKSYVPIAMALEKAADTVGVNFIGGFSALVHKGFTDSDRVLFSSVPEALSQTDRVCSSLNVATTKAGTNMDAVSIIGKIILETAYLTRNENSIGCAKLVVFANVPEDNPFMAGAFHGIGEPECVINVGVSGPGAVRSALAGAKDYDMTKAADIIKKTAFKITRAGQLVAKEAAKRLSVPFGIVDLSLAPTPSVGDSVARILEELGLEVCGGSGTTAALALLNDAVKKGGLMASSHVGGLSGAFIPVSEDEGMIAAAKKGALSLDKLEAMTAVCSVGLDMIAVPGDTSSAVLSAIIADEMAIGVVNNKTTAVRIIPAYGKKAGDHVDFGGLLGFAPVMPVHSGSPEKLISRGGRIPAPMQGLRN